MSDEYLIWWLSESDCRSVEALLRGEDDEDDTLLISTLSAYIAEEFIDLLGRNCRGRLWVPGHIPVKHIDWDDTKLAAKVAAICGGIVIDQADVSKIAYLPGFVTDLCLNMYKGRGKSDII